MGDIKDAADILESSSDSEQPTDERDIVTDSQGNKYILNDHGNGYSSVTRLQKNNNKSLELSSDDKD